MEILSSTGRVLRAGKFDDVVSCKMAMVSLLSVQQVFVEFRPSNF
jgi:hypothetical protein